MVNISRRVLAKYAVDQLLDKPSVSKLAKQLASILLVSKRQDQVDLLLQDIEWQLEARNKLAYTTVTSAHALTEALRKQLKRHIAKAAKVDEALLKETIDESVIGGLRVETAQYTWDSTISKQLSNLQEAF